MIIENAKINATAYFPEPAVVKTDAGDTDFTDVLNAAKAPAEAAGAGQTASARSSKDDGNDRVKETPAKSADERSEPRVEADDNTDAEGAAEVAGADQQAKSDQQRSDTQAKGDSEAKAEDKPAKVEGEAKPAAGAAKAHEIQAAQAKAQQQSGEVVKQEVKADSQAATQQQAAQLPTAEATDAKADKPVAQPIAPQQTQAIAEQAADKSQQVVDPQAVQQNPVAKEQADTAKPQAAQPAQQVAEQVTAKPHEQAQQQTQHHAQHQQQQQQADTPVQSTEQAEAPKSVEVKAQKVTIDQTPREFAGTNDAQSLLPQTKTDEVAPVRVDVAEALASSSAPADGRSAGAAQQAAATGAAANMPDIDTEQVMQRALSGVRGVVSQKGGTVNLRLTPPDLGTLRIQVRMTNGMVQATFSATTQAAGSLLNQNMHTLRQALESHGLTVENLQVQVQQPNNTGQASTQQDAQQSPGDGRSRGSFAGSGQSGQQQGGRSGEDQPRNFNRELLDLVA